MKQTTSPIATGFERFRKTTRREVFLTEMNRLVPWAELSALIEPVYPKPDGADAGRSGSNGCCASISCSSGSTSPIPP